MLVGVSHEMPEKFASDTKLLLEESEDGKL